MGVLGLTPFLQKTIPDVIKRVPDRLKGLSNKTIAFDGTLITQRLHFAPVPHPYRHVLGWYRIIQELRSNGVEAICIFDGKERSTAKAKEALRRKEAQRLVNARQIIERERLNRLVQLLGVLGKVDWDSSSQRKEVSERFKSVTLPKPGSLGDVDVEDMDWIVAQGAIHDTNWYDSIPDVPPTSTSYGLPDQLFNEEAVLSSLTEVYDSTRDLTAATSAKQSSFDSFDGPGFQTHFPVSEHDSVTLPHDAQIPPGTLPSAPSPASSIGQTASKEASHEPPSQELPASASPKPSSYDRDDSQTHLPVTERDSVIQPRDTQTSPNTAPWVPSPSLSSSGQVASKEPPFYPGSVEDIPGLLVSLYHEYRNSIPQVTSVSRASRGITSPDTEGENVEYEMSKTQQQLTKDEGEFWKSFTTSASSDYDSPSTLLATLKDRSFILSESYKRRAHPPTSQHYVEAKEILKAMGVPCVDVEGSFEAEAVASSLVLNGVADFVASEDTDVLVYGAPLIRNISNRREPLSFVSGADIQAALEMSREMFIDFALLLGTDFTQRIKNVGPARALKFIRTHGTIEKIVETETKYPTSIPLDEYFQQIDAGRTVFQTLPPVPEFERVEADETEINFVMGKYGLASELEDYWEHALEGNYFKDNPNNLDDASATF
ncbi:hypothetical protein PQX77_018717 [Marasmius sp. AFHP31]|nr:hypothetical protein PQX77_018717 [Marasmius sp. AFHP31]